MQPPTATAAPYFQSVHEVQRDDDAPPCVDDQLCVAELAGLRSARRSGRSVHQPRTPTGRLSSRNRSAGPIVDAEVADGPPQQRIDVAHIAYAVLDPIVEKGERQAQQHDQRKDERHDVVMRGRPVRKTEEQAEACALSASATREPIPVHRKLRIERPAADQACDRWACPRRARATRDPEQHERARKHRRVRVCRDQEADRG